MNEKLLSFLGLARRAGKLSLGFDASMESVRRRKSQLVILAGDLSERTKASAMATAQTASVDALETAIPMELLGAAVGKSVGIISVNDSGFAKKLKALCEE